MELLRAKGLLINIIVKNNKYKVEVFDFYVVPISINDFEGAIETSYELAKKKNRPSWCTYFSNFNQRTELLLAQISDEMNKKLSTDF
jgi:hypothetical protein